MLPGRYDLPTVWKGTDYGPITFTWLDSDGNPVNLSGWVPHAQSRNIDFAPTIPDPVNGVTQIQLTKDQTVLFQLGVEQWDWLFTNNGSKTEPLLSGMVEIKEPITVTAVNQ